MKSESLEAERVRYDVERDREKARIVSRLFQLIGGDTLESVVVAD